MSHRWPADVDFARVEIEPEDRSCTICGRRTHICDHRHRRIFTLSGPVHIVSKLVHCPDKACPGNRRTRGSEEETRIAPPWWAVGWDVFAWIGGRRAERAWSVPRLVRELARGYDIDLSEDAVERYLKRRRALLAARSRGPGALTRRYRGAGELVMSLEALRPEGASETFVVVCELGRKSAWFAEASAARSEGEVRGLVEHAKAWAEELAVPVSAWVSDGRDAFAEAVSTVFPNVPHRHRSNRLAEGGFGPPRARASGATRSTHATHATPDYYEDDVAGEYSHADSALASLWESDLAA